MKLKIYIIILIILFSAETVFAKTKYFSIETLYSDDFSDWDIIMSNESGVMTGREDYSEWDITLPGGKGNIYAMYMDDYSQWKYKINGKTLTVETAYVDDFTYWKIKGDKIDVTVETLYGDDFNAWKVTGAGTMTVETVYPGDFNQWDIEDNMDKNFDDNLKIAFLFPCIISAIINNN